MVKRRRSDTAQRAPARRVTTGGILGKLDIVHVNLRIHEGLRHRLELIATSERRSLNNVIGVLLEQALAQRAPWQWGAPDKVIEGVDKQGRSTVELFQHRVPSEPPALPDEMANLRKELEALQNKFADLAKKGGSDDKAS
jgi:hypothetical protein